MKCKMCKKRLYGRTNKIFCSTLCKSKYHRKLRRATIKETNPIDIILHRNRSILLEILGKSKNQIKINRITLENKKFRFKYITHYNVNSSGKIYNHVYDFAWMEFSDDDILIVRRNI